MPAIMSSKRIAASRPRQGMRGVATACLGALAAVVFGAPSVFVAPAAPAGGPEAVSSPFVAGGGALETPRGDAEPLTQMHAKYPDRSRLQGGGRLPIRVQRKPVLGYAQASGIRSKNMKTADLERPSGVINRMFDMMDMDYNIMQQAFKRYFRPEYRRVKWLGDWKQKRGRRTVQRRAKQRYDEEWQAWMRTVGRKQGLTKPVTFSGPLAPATPEELELDEWKKTLSPNMFKRKIAPYRDPEIAPDMLPGQWDDGPQSIFKAWRRPLHKHPYDIAKPTKLSKSNKKVDNHVVRGIVF